MDPILRRLVPILAAFAACGDSEATTEFLMPSTTGSSSSSGGDVTTPTSTGPATETSAEPHTDTGTTRPPDTTSTGVDTTAETSSTSTGPGSSGSTSTGDSSSGTDTSESGSSSTGDPGPGCADGAQNQDETDIDCGGSICDGCGVGGVCDLDVDCLSGWCDTGLCADPGCLVEADCDPLDEPCADAFCNLDTKFCELEPTNEGDLCDDGDACSSGEQCTLGVCEGGLAIDCSGLDSVCGLGTCDPNDGQCKANALPDMEGEPCDDGFVCTPDDACSAGLCGVGGPGFVWFEDFSDPDPGIELGPHWAIGPAMASPNGKNGMDPDDDHTPNDDKMLAGTIIGGLLPNGAIAKSCLTTPPIDTGLDATVWLTFWRHLHVDNFPFMTNVVEVWTGKEWIEIESGYPNPGIGDNAWKLISHDLSAYSNDALQVRICFSQTAAAKASGGWSVDDVTIGPFVCTPNG